MTARTAKSKPFPFRQIFGVDFSGARQAGKFIWIAECSPTPSVAAATEGSGEGPPNKQKLPKVVGRLHLENIASLESLAATPDRAPALDWLIAAIKKSRSALWAIDFPFGLPLEIIDLKADFPAQLDHVQAHVGDAYDFGRACVQRALAVGLAMHLFRQIDKQARTPFDCYHYRIVCQTFHGMRDLLRPLWQSKNTAIAPFTPSYTAARFTKNGRVVLEACPSSTLKHLKLPHTRYKQPTGGPLLPHRIKTRTIILNALRKHITITPAHRRTIMRNPGGDALDAVLAAVGAHLAWQSANHEEIQRHPRYPREGFIYYG